MANIYIYVYIFFCVVGRTRSSAALSTEAFEHPRDFILQPIDGTYSVGLIPPLTTASAPPETLLHPIDGT